LFDIVLEGACARPAIRFAMDIRVEIIAVGDEILRGEVADGNTRYICGALASVGIVPERVSFLPDDPAYLADEFRDAFSRGGKIIVTGGLGPTSDDVTKDAAIEALGVEVQFREDIVDMVKSRFDGIGALMPESYADQGRVPAGCEVLPNEVGAAVGLKVIGEGFELYLLPGVPDEMKDIFDRIVFPALSVRGGEKGSKLRTFGLAETDIEGILSDIAGEIAPGCCSIISGPEGVDIHLPHGSPLNDHLEAIRAGLGSYIYTTGDTTLTEAVVGLLRKEGDTISVAESVTGGFLSSTLVSVPGASDVFIDGAVTYSNEAKVRRLGVSAQSIEKFGAVSEPVCIEMAVGMKSRSGSDYSVSTTGIAGPGGATRGKPVGLCFIGLAAPSCNYCKRIVLPGIRDWIRMRASLIALDLVRLELLGVRERLDALLVSGDYDRS